MRDTHIEIMKELMRRVASEPARIKEFEQSREVAEALLAVIAEERFKQVAYHVFVCAFYLAGKSLIESRSKIVSRH